MGVQLEPVKPDKAKLRAKRKICTDKIEATCSNVSSVCGMPVEMTQQAVKTVCKELYKHDVYLSAAEGCKLASLEQPPSKKPSPPVSARDYKSYDYVLPSARTISDYKQMQASQVEQDTAIALWSKDKNVKSTLHYDTTTRNTIDSEWPAIILYFSNRDEYVLRALFFAYEDRKQIIELLVEPYSSLSVATSVDKQENITPGLLWERTNAIMTDSVLKNLKIDDLIGESLGSDHRSYHLLCKSHTVEKLDARNLENLATIEKSVKQGELFESISPSLKSFFEGKKLLLKLESMHS